jgi:hypothetical protein
LLYLFALVNAVSPAQGKGRLNHEIPDVSPEVGVPLPESKLLTQVK